ncbi:adenylate/guanylate cyclase domain-containing protein [Mesorhizobium prunaredense]|uniref:adenylate/guanylate cyclase domain-containing protein n=1 Tax=Mesorhizobium prunaredense TaxID=1631249 RepID=UPI000985E68E|nr:adenylate/guanylate cyclase domain-containing protein [Mesorhizobium prunaredense]
MDRKLAAIFAADVVGYSALMERDEKGTYERLKAGREQLFEPEIARHHGRVFKLMGDGMLAEFGSVVDAVECAASLQRGLAERNAEVPDDQRIQVRIGINLGEMIVEGDDRFGEGVNIATRLEQLAEPGGIWVSGKVAKEVEKKLAFGFEPMGPQRVKNIAEPIQAFRAKLDGALVKRRAPVSARRLAPWAAALAAIAALAAMWFVGTTPADAPTASATIPSIAVLPFDNMGGDPALTYFGDGVAEDIISMLARAPDLSVIARNSSFTYKGRATDIRQVGKELGVGYVLEGSVRKDADKVRIVAQLVDAKSGEHVWAERFDKTGTDPWALQDEVTGKIIGALTGEKGQLKRAQYREAWGQDTANLREYDYYLRGHDLLMQLTPEGNTEAGRIWTQGLAEFPDSALLRIKLGFYHTFEVVNGWSGAPTDDIRRAGQLVREAFAIKGLSPLEKKLAHYLFAYVHTLEGDLQAAVQEAELAVALAPNDAFLRGDCSQFHTFVGNYDKAIDWADFAIRNDPALIAMYAMYKGWAETAAERYVESRETMKEIGDVFVNAPLLRAINAVRLGLPDEAKAEIGKALRMIPGFTAHRWHEIAFASDPAILNRQIADLIAAGLPEK